MVKKLFVWLVGLILFASVGELQAAKLRWRFDLLGGRKTALRTLDGKIVRVWRGYEESWAEGEAWGYRLLGSADGAFYLVRFMVFRGPVGVGTKLLGGMDQGDIRRGVFKVNDTSYSWEREKYGADSFYFPIVIHCILYSKSTDYEDLILYGYLEKSLWNTQADEFVFHEWRWESDKKSAYIFTEPSSYFDIGICLSLNYAKCMPVDFLKLGMIRINYPYKQIPEPWSEHIPLDPTNYFYASLGFSLGYWNLR